MTTTPEGSGFKYNLIRRIVQVISLALFVGGLFGLGSLPVGLPVMFTLGLPQVALGDAFALMQVMLSNGVFPWIPLASFFLVTLFLGRSTCGWVCPFGFTQDIVTMVYRKPRDVSPRTHSWMSNIKYVVLLLVLIISVSVAAMVAIGAGTEYKEGLGVFASGPLNVLGPADTLFAVIPTGISLLVSDTSAYVASAFAVLPLLWVRLIILGFVLVLAALIPRSWCKYFCPHGAIMASLNKYSFLGLQRDPVKCAKAGCNDCVAACPMHVPILELPWDKFTHPECIHCMKCADACPTKAIKPKLA